MSQAVLPPRLMARSLEEMEVGEWAWTVPWALRVDLKMRVWIQASMCDAHFEQSGTVRMHVRRAVDGYECFLKGEPYLYSPGILIESGLKPVTLLTYEGEI